MRSLRFSHAARTTALGTVALAAALSLTACQGGDTSALESAAPAADAPSARPHGRRRSAVRHGRGSIR